MNTMGTLRHLRVFPGRLRPLSASRPIPRSCPFSSQSTSSRHNVSRDTIGIVVFGSICAGAAYLSYWQIERYQWKKLIIKQSKERLASDALFDEFPSYKLSQKDLSDFAGTKRGKKIHISGKFDHSKEILLGPRTAPASATGGPAQGMATNPQGFYVITPFFRNIDNSVLYVNRGWVPKNETTWSRPKGNVDVIGVVGRGTLLLFVVLVLLYLS